MTIDKKDIQGFLLKGYGKMRATRYFLLRLNDRILAKKWLENLSNSVADGEHKPAEKCLNVAVTHPGLVALGLSADNLKDFSKEFKEGLDTDHRNRILGDLGTNGAENWEFGYNKKRANKDPLFTEDNIHFMLMVFARDEEILKIYCREIEEEFKEHKLEIIVPLDGCLLEDNKIHIGFRDGISQPSIAGVDSDKHPNNTVATGEFILGYKNEYGVYPDTPFIYDDKQGDVSLLPIDPGGSGKRDLGFNGSYLVYRKMEEKVDAFWGYTNEKTKKDNGEPNIDESIKLASKMVGRWPNGSPLAKFPDKMPEGLSNDDNFGYQPDDKEGLKCPFGSHMRRNNPRDAFEDNSPELSVKLTKKHRIIRRGRSYGEPLVSSPTNHHPKDKIGLHFMCFNADISDQFEFVQHTWANFPRFENLYNDPDPITGVRDVAMTGEKLVQNFTVQAEPVNKCYKDLPLFVNVKGGSYFFFPSISAIRYLSTI